MTDNAFLKNQEITRKINDLMKGKNRRLAVAFWSEKWINNCNIGFKNSKVILDVSMGMTSAEAITALTERGAEVRHKLNFHGKMYLSDRGGIVGSANASMNALGIGERTPNFIEFATLIKKGTQEFISAETYFEQLFDNSGSAVEAKSIARRLYRPDRIARAITQEFDSSSILDLVRSDPGAFGDIGFVFCGTPAVDSKKAREQDIRLSKETGLQIDDVDIKRSVIFSNWSPDEISAWPDQFVEFYFTENGNVKINAYRTIVRNSNERRVRAMRYWKKLFSDRGIIPFKKDHLASIDYNKSKDIWVELNKLGRVFTRATELRDLM